MIIIKELLLYNLFLFLLNNNFNYIYISINYF